MATKRPRVSRIRSQYFKAVFGRNWLLILLIAALLIAAWGLIDFGMSETEHGWQSLALHLGSELISAVLIFIVFERLLQRVETAKIRPLPKFDHSGVVENIGFSKSSEILILETWTNLFDQDKTYPYKFTDVIVRALDNHCNFRILILKPGSRGMNKRQEALDGDKHQERIQNQDWDPEHDAELQILENVSGFAELQILENVSGFNDIITAAERDKRQEKFQVRVYEEEPTIALYQWREKGNASFFPPEGLSDESEQLEFSADSDLSRFLSKHFERLWDDKDFTHDLQKIMYKEGILKWEGGKKERTLESLLYVQNISRPRHSFCIADQAIETYYFEEYKKQPGKPILLVIEGKTYTIATCENRHVRDLFNAKYHNNELYRLTRFIFELTEQTTNSG
jgi:hypothetical protein